MPDISDIMSQYLDTAMAPMSVKLSGVAAAAEQKKMELDPQGYLDGATRDVGYGNDPMDPAQPIDPISLLARAAGDSRYIAEASHQRTMPQAIGDGLNSAAQSMFMTPVEIGNIGVSAVSPDAGAAVNRFIQQGLDNAQAQQSDALNDRRRAYAARSEITSSVNARKQKDEIAQGSSEFVAGLRRVGRDAIDAFKNNDSVLVSDLIANAAGSLVTSGPIGKAVGFAGKAAMPISIGLQEAGGVHHQTTNEILNMSHEDLAANSPEYRDAIAQGMDPEQARNLVARNAGLEAAAIQFPVAAAAGTLVGQFEKAPFRPQALIKAGGNMLKEGVEEGIQSGSGQLAQNVATRDNANENQDLLEGVGEQVGQGIVGGIGSAAVTSTPGAVLKTAVDTVKGAANLAMRGVKAVGNTIDERFNAVQEANEKASPVSDENVGAAVGAAVAAAPEAQATVSQAIDESGADEAQKARGTEYAQKLANTLTLSPEELQDPDMPAELKDVLASSEHRYDAIGKLADLIEEGKGDQLTTAATLHKLVSVVDDVLQEADAGAIDGLADDHPAKKLVSSFEQVLSSIRQAPKVAAALKRIDEIAAAADIKPVTEAEIATPAGKQTVRNTIAVAEASPLNANPDANDTILRHAETGSITLTNAQRLALQASSALVRAQRDRLAELERLKLTTNRDIVSEDILTRDSGQETKQLSVAGHVKRIVAAARAGDNEASAEYLNSLVRFAQHMQNKVEALNEALTTGANSKDKVVRYQTLLPSGKFRLSGQKTGMWVNPYAPGSVKTAQQVAADAAIVARVANELVASFPDLKVQPVQAVELNKSLNGVAEEVSQAFREGRANSADQTIKPAAPKQEPKQEQSTPEPEATGQPEGGDQSAKVQAEQEAQRQRAQAEAEAAPEETKAEEPKVEQSPAVEDKPEASTATEDAPSEATADTSSDRADEAVQAEPARSVFDKLPGWSRLKQFFRIPDQPRTRIIGTDSPVETISKAFSSAKTLEEFIGSKLKHNFTAEVAREYEIYLANSEKLKAALTKRLAESKKVKARFLAGEDRLPTFPNGRVLNLTEEIDGDLAYNQELLEGAILAGLQWKLVADRFQSEWDEEDAAKFLDIQEDVFTDTVLDKDQNRVSLVSSLNEGLTLVEAKRSLARMIKSYWGLEDKPNGPMGYLEGIPEAMAAEVLHALMAVGEIERKVFTANEESGLNPGETRTVYVFTSKKFSEDNPLLAFPDAIDQAVLTDPEPATFIGEAPTKVAETQLRNSIVKLTDQQKDAIRFEQKQPHFANLPMVNLFTALDMSGVLKLFGAGDIETVPLNVMDLKSKKGVNQTFGSSYQSLIKLMAELRNRASVDGTEIDQLPIFYDYAFTRVNRMQMLGLNNPQASKLMREAVLPTRSTLDLSGEQFSAFTLALAQALGEKVHNQSLEISTNNVLAKLEGPLKDSVELLQSWLKDQSKTLTADQVETLAKGLGKENTPVALHAIMEYARYLNADEKARKAFTTSLYVEADGVTNGPVNAMQLLTPGRFTVQWLKNIRKGGLFVGSSDMTMNNHRQFRDADDLYTATTSKLAIFMADLTRQAKTDGKVDEHMKALSRLMDTFLPDVEFKGDKLTFKRGVAKNPLTITIYGSAAKGIANKVARELMDEIYERLSLAMQHSNEKRDGGEKVSFAEALFPDDTPARAQQKYNDFLSAMDVLTTNIVKKYKSKLYVTHGDDVPNRNFHPKDFALGINELKNLQQNIRMLFVEPLRDAIRETVGDELLHPKTGSANLLRQAIQIQSIFLSRDFKQQVQDKLEENGKDPERSKNDFLSRDELAEIRKKQLELAPIVDTGSQRFFVSGKQSVDVGAKEFGNSLDDDMRTDAFVEGPADAGVGGIPAMVIGTGDGMMMQLASTTHAVDRTLKVFDGMHLPLDNLVEGSQKANQAVFGSWMGNPLQAVSKSYTAFLGAVNLDEFHPDQKQTEALGRALNLSEEEQTLSNIREGIAALGPKLELMSKEIEARHKVLARIGLTVDQMASVGSPYVHEGDVSLEGLTDEQIISRLNELYNEELDRLSKPAPKAEPAETKAETKSAVSENIAPELESVGRLLKNGARVVSHTALKKLVRSLNVPADHKALLGDVLRTLVTKEYKIVYGSPEQVQAYADERGLNLQGDERDGETLLNGFIIPSQRTIYLHNPTSEILLHELIHAGTFDILQAHYAGEDLGPNSASQVEAIQRLEKLMDQFLGLSMHKEDEATQKAFFDATDEIEYRLGRGERAHALNEFMAWGLANSKLQDLQKKTTSNVVVQLARKVVMAIKQLIAGRRQLPSVGNDMFSNLRFNTNVLLQAKFDARKRFADTALFHSSSYGNSDRLMQINRTLNQKIVRHLQSAFTEGSEAVRNRRIANEAARIFSKSDVIMNVVDQGFTMNAQERTTFQVLVSTLATTVELDPNALTRVQDLYAHVTKNLKVEDFMRDPESHEPADFYNAKQKFDVIVGNAQVETDDKDRSSLLPVFLGLATVNNEFRSILAKMEVPKSEKRTDRTLDAILTNAGVAALDSLTAHVSGEGQKAPHVQAAIDALLQRVMDTAEDRESYMAQMASPVGNAIDRANEIIVEAMQKLAEGTVEKADQIKANTNNKVVKTFASAAKGLAGIIDERTGSKVAEGIMSELNRGEYFRAFRELVNDLIGRTESNAQVYDMIKRVRDLVQQRRQQFREHLPKVISSKFTRTITDPEWTAMFHGLGKTDLAALRPHLTKQQLLDIIEDPQELTDRIDALERELTQLEPDHHQKIQEKAKQLAKFMNTGEPGTNLLRNAKAVANLFGEGVNRSPASDALINTVDQLATLYAFEGLPQTTKDTLSSLVQSESDGISFVMDYLVGQRKDELDKTHRGAAEVNHYKGALPAETQSGMTLIVANDSDHAELIGKSFVRVGNYVGSNLDRGVQKGYYFAPVSGRAVYNQGIIQNIRPTAYGIDLASGFTHGLTAGRIEDPATVRRIYQRMGRENAQEPLLPVYDNAGQIVAYERSIDPRQLERLNHQTNLSKIIGIWRGRQLEELEAQHVNERLIDRLHEMWEKDLREDPTKKAEYIDVRDPREQKKDPVLADAVKLFSSDTHAYIDSVFGEKFFVRRDMLNDALGYRSASVGDLWTDNSRLPANVLSGAQKVAVAVFGNDAYKRMVNAEKTLQNLVSDARVLIVVKSIVVPVTNLTANVYQLWSRGVPIADIVRGMPRKTAEVNAYLKSRLRLDEAEAELRAASGDQIRSRKLEAEMQSIRDSHRRMSIWPLIEAGEFSSISDGTLTHDDLTFGEGRLSEWIEKKVDQLPGHLRTAGRYGIISRDTALFQALQRSVEYGDFLAKAVLYDHLTKQKKLSQENALARITEEFVNYDRLAGRSRSYLENMGLLWFWNFKVRSTKVALSMIRNNPVHALLAAMAPHPTMFGSVGSPVEDNVFSMFADNKLGWSTGPGMGLRAHELNPWVNLVS